MVQEAPHLAAAAAAAAGPGPKAESPAKQAVSLRFLFEFAAEHLTGPMAGTTTGDLVDALIKKWTEAKKCRFTALLKPADVWSTAAGAGTAEDKPKVYFISHAFRRVRLRLSAGRAQQCLTLASRFGRSSLPGGPFSPAAYASPAPARTRHPQEPFHAGR